MHRPEPAMPATEGRISSIAPADSWGEEKVAREIALLEAHLSEEKITRLIEKAFAEIDSAIDSACGGEIAKETRQVNIEDELRQSYLDYAVSVILGRALPCGKAIRNIQTFSRRAMIAFPHFAHGLSAALAIHRLTCVDKVCSALLLKLRKSAESALFSLPLFAYGPELSDFRHRLR